nr:high osmolarity sensitivity protein 3 [Quercus suber]
MSHHTARTPSVSHTTSTTNRLSTVSSSASKARQLSHLHAQLAQLTANMSDLENLLRMTAVQAEGMKGLGGYAGGMFMAASKVLGEEAANGTGDKQESSKAEEVDHYLDQIAGLAVYRMTRTERQLRISWDVVRLCDLLPAPATAMARCAIQREKERDINHDCWGTGRVALVNEYAKPIDGTQSWHQVRRHLRALEVEHIRFHLFHDRSSGSPCHSHRKNIMLLLHVLSDHG